MTMHLFAIEDAVTRILNMGLPQTAVLAEGLVSQYRWFLKGETNIICWTLPSTYSAPFPPYTRLVPYAC